jgi:APA family basic amino acid/polyamine antiporter
MVLRKSLPNAVRPFRTPWVPFVPVMGIIVCVYLMYTLPAESWFRLFIWMTIGVIIYFIYGKKHSKVRELRDGKIIEKDKE